MTETIAMMSKIACYLLSGACILVSCQAIHAASNPGLHQGCYGVLDPKDKATVQNAQEVLCVDAAGQAVVRESSLYGEGVKGCNTVHVDSHGDTLTVDIDYERCTNNAPSHRLTCHPNTTPGAFACTDAMIYEKSDDPSDPPSPPAEPAKSVLAPLTE